MRLKRLDLIIAMLFALLNIAWALLPYHSPYLDIIFALPLVFLLPGYTFTEALFMHSKEDDGPLIRKPLLKVAWPIRGSDRLILSLGLSLAIDILSGFILNMLPIGLRPLSWATFLGLLTMIFSLIAAFRRRGSRQNTTKGKLKISISIYGYILCAAAVTIVFLTALYAISNLSQQQSPNFTQFWMLPSKQRNDSCAVLLGIDNQESTSLSYRVVVKINGSQVATWESVVLAPQAEWDQLISAKPEDTNTLFIDALLYRVDKPETIYREVHVTLNISGGSKDPRVEC